MVFSEMTTPSRMQLGAGWKWDRDDDAPNASSAAAMCYRFLPTAVLAAIACFFFWSALLAAACFCEDFFWLDFGDLSPMGFVWFCDLPAGRNVSFSVRVRTVSSVEMAVNVGRAGPVLRGLAKSVGAARLAA